jgi:WD40 repeat protein
LPHSPLDDFEIRCIVPHSKGFVIGGSNCTFWIYNKNEKDMRNPYVKEDRRIYNKDPKFSNLFVNSFTLVNDDTIVCGVENGSLLEVPFSNEKQTPDEKFNFEDLIQPFHTQRITDFDICLRKPLIATCSYDKSVKIWNYLDYTLENSKEFDQTAQAISFHPSGFHVAVAFTDRVRMLNILYSEKKND